MIDKKEYVSLLQSLVGASSHLAYKVFADKSVTGAIAGERALVKKLLKMAEFEGTEEEINNIVCRELAYGYKIEPPVKTQQPADVPWKGARLVKLYILNTSAVLNKHVVGIRKRGGDAGFEVAEGIEDWGYRLSNSFKGYIWRRIHQVCKTEEEALESVKQRYTNTVREGKIKDTSKNRHAKQSQKASAAS